MTSRSKTYPMAKLRYHYGVIGSAKTLRLLTTAYNFEENGIRFLAMKPSVDTRESGDVIHSRIGIERECIMIDETVNIFDFIETYLTETLKLDWILVDECQFLTEQQVEQLANIVDKHNINVLCFGLRTDFSSHAFEGSRRLFELADEIEEIKARCRCGKKASINARIDDDGHLIFDGEQVVIGGNERYRAMCRKCYFEKKRLHDEQLKETSCDDENNVLANN